VENITVQEKAGKRSFVAFLSGIVFAIGLYVGGLTDPKTMIGFLDLLGSWNPQVLFVIIGALLIHIPAYMYFNKIPKPVLDEKKHLPLGKNITKDLVVGSLIFGVGLALSGFCPGSGLVAAMEGNWSAVTFAIALTVGMAIHHFYQQFFAKETF
jgi:uncharacterized protein